MNDEREILVHISTSATRRNDNLYRSLVDAYHQFEPCDANPGGPPSSALGTIPNVTTSKDSYGSFPSHIDSGGHSSSHNQTDTQMPSSLDEDSQRPTSRLDQLERIHVKWRQMAPGTSVLRPNTRAPLSSALSDGAFIDDTQLAYQAIQSQLLDNLSATSEDTSDDDSGVVCTPLAESAGNPQTTPVTTNPNTSVSLKSSEADPAVPRATIPGVTTHYNTLSKDGTSQVQSQELNSQRHSFQVLPVEVFPPAPTVSIEDPRTLPSQITKFLGTLKEHNPNRFKPQRQFRTLDRDERGCWAVDSSTWPRTTQSEFWASLSGHVGSGRLGWGVTLHRDISHRRELGLVRLYCWGEIVEHIWLVLWLCSGGRILSAGSKWFDGEETVVMEA